MSTRTVPESFVRVAADRDDVVALRDVAACWQGRGVRFAPSGDSVQRVARLADAIERSLSEQTAHDTPDGR